MKLDESVVESLWMKFANAVMTNGAHFEKEEFYSWFDDLDLVIKPGDQSQSVLVNNEVKVVDYAEIYDKRK